MEQVKVREEELQKLTIIAGLINLPEKQPAISETVGCKGCEGGCAAEICAR